MDNDLIILALDTSSTATSMALLQGDGVLGSYEAELDEKRSERLWLEINSLLGKAGLTIGDVDLFAVCVGPGSFTGLRVGLAAVKGLAVATHRPVVGITSLEALAFDAGPAPYVCAISNAYKGEVYSQLFSFDGEGEPVAEGAPTVTTLEEALSRVAGLSTVLFAGSGGINNQGKMSANIDADCGASIMTRTVPTNGGSELAQHAGCLAIAIGRLARARAARGETDTPQSLKACYIRQAEAEIKLAKGLLGSKIRRVLGR